MRSLRATAGVLSPHAVEFRVHRAQQGSMRADPKLATSGLPRPSGISKKQAAPDRRLLGTRRVCDATVVILESCPLAKVWRWANAVEAGRTSMSDVCFASIRPAGLRSAVPVRRIEMRVRCQSEADQHRKTVSDRFDRKLPLPFGSRRSQVGHFLSSERSGNRHPMTAYKVQPPDDDGPLESGGSS